MMWESGSTGCDGSPGLYNSDNSLNNDDYAIVTSSDRTIYRHATFSADNRYRYSLTRTWNSKLPTVVFIGLNPSTASAEFDDPTISRCMGFARSWKFGGLIMLNLFAYRTRYPAELKKADNPVEKRKGWNNSLIKRAAKEHPVVVAAWGTHGAYMNRGFDIEQILSGNLYYLKLNKDSTPAHPLYLAKSHTPVLWTDRNQATKR